MHSQHVMIGVVSLGIEMWKSFSFVQRLSLRHERADKFASLFLQAVHFNFIFHYRSRCMQLAEAQSQSLSRPRFLIGERFDVFFAVDTGSQTPRQAQPMNLDHRHYFATFL